VLTIPSCFLACSSPSADESTCAAAVIEQPLVNGTSDESYLGLASGQLRAVVPIVDRTDDRRPLCTGTFIAPDWVITGAHCLQIASPQVIVSVEPERAFDLRVIESVPHPSADVALLQVELPQADALEAEIAPLGVPRANSFAVTVGVVVELAGYGLTEVGDERELRFVAEPIVGVEDDSVVVDGFGANGACAGDSGGPILVRGPDGAALILGVLTSGASSCVGRDRYVRLDSLSEWIEQTIGALGPFANGCGGITEEGRCLYGSALHCRGTALVAEACAGETSCGWDANQSGFRCVRPSADPCSGVDSVGVCRNGAALSCHGGVLEQDTCGCEQICRIDGKTGGPRCSGSAR
jgi:hypothetical protein